MIQIQATSHVEIVMNAIIEESSARNHQRKSSKKRTILKKRTIREKSRISRHNLNRTDSSRSRKNNTSHVYDNDYLFKNRHNVDECNDKLRSNL